MFIKCPQELHDFFDARDRQKSIHVSHEFIQDMSFQKMPRYIKPITDKEIAEWKEGEKLLSSINIEEAKKRVKLERDPNECPPYMTYEEWENSDDYLASSWFFEDIYENIHSKSEK